MPNANPFVQVKVDPVPTYRGGTPAGTVRFYCNSMNLSWAWGSDPAQATLLYYRDAAPVTIGQLLTIIAPVGANGIGAHTFYGVCKSDVSHFGSDGSNRKLEFADSREFMDWDLIYGAFNKDDSRVINGVRTRRWKHLLPANFNAWRWTYTTTPLTAAQILNYIFGAVTVQDPWVRTYHADQTSYPVYDIDCTGGTKLKAVLQEITDKQGLLFTLKQTGRFDLQWVRKGEGVVPAFASDSDNRDLGTALSGNPTRIRVLGERNVYQVHNITMQKDWKTAWETYWDGNLVYKKVMDCGVTLAEITIDGTNYPAGTDFVTIRDLPDQKGVGIADNLARARANEITVREFAALHATPSDFHDYRKFEGRSRMDMPAMLYVGQILFRAFRLPDNFRFKNGNGVYCYADSIAISNRMVAKVSHNPTTGVMTWDDEEALDGRGYAIVKGYQVGKDLFATLKPETLDLTAWGNVQNIWQHIEFQVDESGDTADAQFIVFDEPIIASADLIEWVNGLAVFKAQPTLTSPPVKVALPFLAEKFSYVGGTGNRDERESVPGLWAEHAMEWTGTGVGAEIAFSDGQTAAQKAAVIVTSLLNRQFSYVNGSSNRHLAPDVNGNYAAGTQLTGVIDRVSVEVSPSGITERIQLTNELARRHFVPERELDRRNRERDLLPGQAELRSDANQRRMVAAGLARDSRTRKVLADLFNGFVGIKPDAAVTIKPPA